MTPVRPIRVSALTAACGLAFFLTACSDTSKDHKPTAQERQDRAIKDPFGYKPDWDGTSVGGGTAELDKDGLRKDLNNVLR